MERARRYRNEAGLEVLAITAPIYNEPACYTSPCHFHTADQKILGTLDIGLSVAPLIKTLSVMRWRMAIFSLLVLFLTIGGVAALLQRQVFIPLRIIKEFTANIKHGNLNQKLSGVSGELNDLADDIRSVATRLRNAEEELARLKKPQE